MKFRTYFRFLYKGKTDKIKRNTVIGNYGDDGLNIHCLHSFIHALNVLWVKKVLDAENKWEKLSSYVPGILGRIQFGFISVVY